MNVFAVPSSLPEHAPRRLRWGLILVALAALSPAAYWGYWRYHLKRFAVVRPGVMYRTGQPTEYGFERLRDELGVKTVLTLRTDEAQLFRGLLDAGQPDGEPESRFVPALGVNYLRWPMGDEAYWPWITPWQFEEFYKLFDEPENCPVLVHCVGGRHRTGTISAMYRLEYDRWSPDRAIAEMLSFDFGPTVAVHDLNLRTYWPRPLPTDAEWKSLQSLAESSSQAPHDIYELVRGLKPVSVSKSGAAYSRIEEYVNHDRPFAICLALRLIDSPQHPLVSAALKLAADRIEREELDLEEGAAAAALIADFGSPEQQARLLAILRQELHRTAPSPRYRALTTGVANRYTANRIAFLVPLLADRRARAEPAAKQYRYCDTAAARLMSIVDEPFLQGGSSQPDWNDCVSRAEAWFATHPDFAAPSQLQPPLRPPEAANPQLAAPADRDERRR